MRMLAELSSVNHKYLLKPSGALALTIAPSARPCHTLAEVLIAVQDHMEDLTMSFLKAASAQRESTMGLSTLDRMSTENARKLTRGPSDECFHAFYRLNDKIFLLCECERAVDVALVRAGSVCKGAAVG